MTENTRNLEMHEMLSQNDYAWLGGFMETGGTLGLHTRNPRCASYPVFQVTDQDAVLFSAMRERFGGDFRERGNSFMYRIQKDELMALLPGIAPFAPSRAKAIEKIFELNDIEGNSERYRVARSTSYSERSKVGVETYIDLLANPAFRAGVIDARGDYDPQRRSPNGTKASFSRRINLATTNYNLQHALALVLGGSVSSKTSEASYGTTVVYTLHGNDKVAGLYESIANFSLKPSPPALV